MKKLNLRALLTLLLIASVFSCNNIGYKKTKSGIEYRIIKKGKGRKVEDNDYVKKHVVNYIGDSLVYDSHKEQPNLIQFKKSILNNNMKYNIMDVLEFANQGDSIVTRVLMDSIFKEVEAKPSFYKKGKYMKLLISIVDVKNEKENDSELIVNYKQKSEVDKKVIDSFVDKNKINGVYNEYNVFVSTVKEGRGHVIEKDSSVYLKLTGKLLDGKVFYSNIENKKTPAVQFKAGNKQMIPGLDYSILKMRKGGRFRMIIPSSLAYGERGAGSDILPNSILDFYIEIE